MLWGILGSTALYYIFMGLGCAWGNEKCIAMFSGITIDNPFTAFGYSISKGIGVGIISCIVVKICTGKIKEISVVTWIIAALFILMFVLTN